jgi:hypothetical protein
MKQTQTPLEEMRTRAMKHYEVASASIQDWSSFVRDAIMSYTPNDDLKKRSEQIELLEEYSMFLEREGYLDVDWRTEDPFYSIDTFLKLKNLK